MMTSAPGARGGVDDDVATVVGVDVGVVFDQDARVTAVGVEGVRDRTSRRAAGVGGARGNKRDFRRRGWR